MRRRVLFISWDGPAQQYMESLFFPLLSAASCDGLQIGVLQFTWASAPQRLQTAEAAARYGLAYTSSDAIRRPRQLAVPAMIAYGAARIIAEADRGRWDTLMPRAIIPAAMCLLALRARPHLRLIFDADGLMADERVEFAGWRPDGLQYRLFRDWEAQALRRSEAIIVRTIHARRILSDRAGAGFDTDKIHVIPNAKDSIQFAPQDATSRAAIRARFGVESDAPWVVYAGSLGPQYHAPAMLRLFERIRARRPDARLLLLSGMGEEVAGLVAGRAGVEVRRVAPDEVAPILGAASLGLSLRQPSFSQQAVCPIKVAEYLLCGLPVVATAGVGDLDERLSGVAALRLLKTLDDAALDDAAAWFVDEAQVGYGRLSSAAREAGLREFALTSCAGRLRHVIFGQLATSTESSI